MGDHWPVSVPSSSALSRDDFRDARQRMDMGNAFGRRAVGRAVGTAALGAILVIAFASAAAAQASALGAPQAAARGPTPITVEVLGGTTAPIDVGATVRLVLFERLSLGGSIGGTVYGRPVGDVVGGFTTPAAGSLVSSLIDGGLVLRAVAALRPFGADGLELAFAYVFFDHGASATGAQLSGVFGTQVPVDAIGAHLTVHALSGELGWTILLFDHVIVRPAIGWTQAFAASASLSASGADANVQQGLDAASTTIAGAVARWAMTPTASLSVGYRF